MSIKKSLEAVYKKSPQLANRLAQIALVEPYEEIQNQVIGFIFDKNPELLLTQFDSYSYHTKKYIKHFFNLRKIVRGLLKETLTEERENIYNYLAFDPTLEDYRLLCDGIEDKQKELRVFCINRLKELSLDIMKNPTKYLDNNYALIAEIAYYMMENYDIHKDENWVAVPLLLKIEDSIRFVKAVMINTDSDLYKIFLQKLLKLNNVVKKASILAKILSEGEKYTITPTKKILLDQPPGVLNLLFSKISYSADPYSIFSLFEPDELGKLLEKTDNIDRKTGIVLMNYFKTTSSDLAYFALVFERTDESNWKYLLNDLPQPSLPKISLICARKSKTDIIEFLLPEAEKNFQDIEKTLAFLRSLKERAVENVVKFIDKRIAKYLLILLYNNFDDLTNKDKEEMIHEILQLDKTLVKEIIDGIYSVDSSRKKFISLRLIQLGSIDSELGTLSEKLVKDDDPKVVAVALNIVDISKMDESVVKELSKHPDKRVRANLVESIEKIKNAKFIQLLNSLAEDDSNRVKANTAKALYSFGYKADALTVLKDMLESGSEQMRLSAYWALAQIKSRESIELLIHYLKTEKSERIRARTREFLHS